MVGKEHGEEEISMTVLKLGRMRSQFEDKIRNLARNKLEEI